MIAITVVHKIRLLLGEGTLSQRKIASRLGISRGTVNSIALGKRPDRIPDHEDDDFVPPSGLPQRCPTCGALVQMPCLACRVRALKGLHEKSGLKTNSLTNVLENGRNAPPDTTIVGGNPTRCC